MIEGSEVEEFRRAPPTPKALLGLALVIRSSEFKIVISGTGGFNIT